MIAWVAVRRQHDAHTSHRNGLSPTFPTSKWRMSAPASGSLLAVPTCRDSSRDGVGLATGPDDLPSGFIKNRT